MILFVVKRRARLHLEHFPCNEELCKKMFPCAVVEIRWRRTFAIDSGTSRACKSLKQPVHCSETRKAEICHFLPSTQDPSPTQAMCFHHDYQTLISFASLFNPLKVKNMSEETASTLPSLTKFIVSYKNRPSDVAFYSFPIRMRCIHETPLRKL